MDRRTLLKSTAVAGFSAISGSALMGCASAHAERPDFIADVLVVGAGLAGLTAAVCAARSGAKVIVIDNRIWFGGDGLVSAGQFYSARTPLHDAAGITKNVEVEDYWKQIESGVDDEPLNKVRDNLRLSVIYSGVTKHNPAVLHRSAEYSPKVVEFVQSYGIKFRKMNPAKPFQCPTENGSMALFTEGMVKEIEKRGGSIVPSTRATELLTENGAIVGVKATTEDEGEKIFRAKSVIIATGGFLNNPHLMERYKRFWARIPTGFTAVGEGVPPDHTGDGIVMTMKIGGAVEDMESMPKLYAGPQKGTPGISWIMFDVDTAYLVTKAGKRITNEHESRYSGCALKLLSTHNEVGYAIFDEQTFTGPNRDRWQFDKALAKGGLFKANTPEELAKKVGVDPKGLRETIDRINRDAKKGKDTEQGRTDKLFRALKAPFYITAPNWPLSYKTEGGIEVNPDFQVIRAADETPIPGLYAIGSTCGSISTRLCDVVASGLIVGPIAAKAAKK